MLDWTREGADELTTMVALEAPAETKVCVAVGCERVMPRVGKQRICETCKAHEECLRTCCRACGAPKTGRYFCAACVYRRSRHGVRVPKPCCKCGAARVPGVDSRGVYCARCVAEREAERNRRRSCHRCGGPKRDGQGIKLCEACHEQVYGLAPCVICGERAPKMSHGSKVCAECAETARWRTRQRARARKGMLRKVCRDCGRPKGPGVRRIVCPSCAARRERDAAQPRMCGKCGRLPVTAKYAKFCEACREMGRISSMETRARWSREHRRRPVYVKAKKKRRGAKLRPMVPTWPLIAALDAYAQRLSLGLAANGATGAASVSVLVGIDQRILYAWRSQEREYVNIDVAQECIDAIRALWHDVYNAETVRVPALRVSTYAMRRRGERGTRKPKKFADPCTGGKVVLPVPPPSLYRERTGGVRRGDGGPDLALLTQVQRAFEGKRCLLPYTHQEAKPRTKRQAAA